MQWAPAFVGLVMAMLATYLTRAVARKLSIVANPNPIVPQHREPVAYLGGVGLAVGLICGILFSLCRPGFGVVVGGLGMLLLGLVDDLRPFRPVHKLLAQTIIAVVAAALGVSWGLTGNMPLDFTLSAFLILTWVNAVNLTDVCDGLVGGLAAIAFLGLFAIGGFSNPVSALAAVACCGFLVFNKPPASIYLGDAGSHLLGFLLAAISLENMDSGGWKVGVGTVMCSTVFFFELIFLVVVRAFKGLPWWRGSPDHFSLRLQAGPFTRWQTVLLAWAVGGALSGVGFQMAHMETQVVFVTLGLVMASALAVTFLLLRWEVPGPQGDSRQEG